LARKIPGDLANGLVRNGFRGADMPFSLGEFFGEMDNGQGEVQPVIGDRDPYDVFAVSGVMPMGWQYDPNKSAEENEFEKQKALYEERKNRYDNEDEPVR